MEDNSRIEQANSSYTMFSGNPNIHGGTFIQANTYYETSHNPSKRRKISDHAVEDNEFDYLGDLPKHVSTFVGREKYLNELADKLTQNDRFPLAVLGLRGIGKTELVIEYVIKYGKAKYNGFCFFINASSKAKLEDDFKNLAEKLDINEGIKTKRIISIYQKLSKSNEKNLLIFDDAKNYKVIKEYLPNEHLFSRFDIVVTSFKDTWSSSRSIKLDLHDESIQNDTSKYIKEFLNRNQIEYESENIVLFAKQFNYHPLAIDQALHFIHHKKIGISTYLEKYDDYSNRTRFLNASKIEGKRTLLIAWTIILDEINENSKKFTETYAYFSDERLPQNILKSYFSNLDFDEVIAPLLNCFVIQKEVSADKSIFYKMHSLFSRSGIIA